MIASGLSSLEGVVCLPAIFTHGEWPGQPGDLLFELRSQLDPAWDDHTLRNRKPYVLLRELMGLIGDRASLFGWKHHLIQEANVTEMLIKNAAIKKIILRRDNLLASFSSDRIVRLTGQGRADRGTNVVKTRCVFDAEDFKTYCFRRNSVHKKWADIALRSRSSALIVQYEQAAAKEGFAPILKFLGLDPGLRVEPTSLKRNPSDILSRFENPENVMTYLQSIGREDWATEGSEKPIKKKWPANAGTEAGHKLFAEHDHTTAYRLWNNAKVAADPQEAVGGMWEKIGALQFSFLKTRGLRPNHSLLDIGCGTLRAGRHFIRYMDAGRYTGFDLSDEAIKFAKRLVEGEGLSTKKPNIFLSDGRLTFKDFDGRQFGFILAQSVFTHLPIEAIDECFENIASVMHARSRFFFTLLYAKAPTVRHVNTFLYPFADIEALAKKRGLILKECPDYVHPRDQRMIVATIGGDPTTEERDDTSKL